MCVVQPANIFLCANDLLKIGDLGVSKVLKNSQYTRTLIGTPIYMAPEVRHTHTHTHTHTHCMNSAYRLLFWLAAVDVGMYMQAAEPMVPLCVLMCVCVCV